MTNPRLRQLHRLLAPIFTLTVAANFAAMPFGQPPAWITYAPLPPLFILMTTGIAMYMAPFFKRSREAIADNRARV